MLRDSMRFIVIDWQVSNFLHLSHGEDYDVAAALEKYNLDAALKNMAASGSASGPASPSSGSSDSEA